MEVRAARPLHAVHRPEHLLDAADHPTVKRPSGEVIDGKRAVLRRMPVLRQDADLGLREQPIHQRHDGVAVVDRESPSRTKIVLQIDDDESFGYGARLWAAVGLIDRLLWCRGAYDLWYAARYLRGAPPNPKGALVAPFLCRRWGSQSCQQSESGRIGRFSEAVSGFGLPAVSLKRVT